MKATVFHGVGDIRLEEVKEPKIKDPFDAIVRITASAICGTDLHMIRGTMSGMKEGTILGHEGVGVVEELGEQVRNFKKGDRVVIASSVACGYCSYCRQGYFSQCDNGNPKGNHKTCFFGGLSESGALDGMQAQWVRVPYANVGMVKLPDEVTDDQAILLSDIFPMGYFGASLAQIKDGDTVAVFGCGPVGQFSILSAFLMGAGRVLAVDHVHSRLSKAQDLGAETINFDHEDPITAIKELTGGIGVDRAIDAVGVDSVKPEQGPSAKKTNRMDFDKELKVIAPQTNPKGDNWRPGDAPSLAMRWAVEAIAKAGTLSIIGEYPDNAQVFPLGMALHKNLTVNMGSCNHRRYIPKLLGMVKSGMVHPEEILSNVELMSSAIEAYEQFDRREEGWLKVELLPT